MGTGGRNKFLSVKKQENTFTHILESKSWWNKDSGFIRVIIRIYINDNNEDDDDDDEGSKNSSILTQVDDFLCFPRAFPVAGGQSLMGQQTPPL